MPAWCPESWQEKPCQQRVIYPAKEKLVQALSDLEQLPPLVTRQEIELLKQQLAQASLGKRFVIHGGDCAETFADCNIGNITNTLKILLQISLVFVHGLHKPVTRIGRFAGQYAKPRTNESESRGEIKLPSYRGDLINSLDFDWHARQPDPQRLLKGYHYAALTINYIRALVNGGFADLKHPENWDMDFVKNSPHAEQYRSITQSLKSAIEFLSTVDGYMVRNVQGVEFFTSHEAYNLYYEQALTKQSPDGQWYAGSTHMPWIGMRTGDLQSAHIEYARGITNPVAVKVGPQVDEKWIRELIELLNPNNEVGRLVLITRLGCQHVQAMLPDIIQWAQSTGKNVVWMTDPMHGNTRITKDGIKTRSFDEIQQELSQTLSIHKQNNSILAGVHIELTGDNVTECIGGAGGLTDDDLHQAYKSLVDPRLNYDQSLEFALNTVNEFTREH